MAEETKIIRIIVDSSKAVDGSAAATRALEKLERSTASMDGALSRMERGLASVGGMVKAQLALMVAELGARFVQMGKDSLNAVAGLDELAEQLGITTTGLQALQFSAVQNGVKLEQLETGISKFSQKMGEAAGGSKEMVEALTALGVKNLDVQGKLRPTEALLSEVAAAITKIEDPAKRSAAAVDFFGKAGSRMLPMLSDIASGTDAMAAAAKAGGAMIDASIIKSLDKMSDEAEKSGLKMRALFAEIAAPILTEGLERVNGLLGGIADQLARGKASGQGFWATVLNDSKAQGQIGSGPGALKLATPAQMEAFKRAELEKELANQWNPDSRAFTQAKIDALSNGQRADRQISYASEEDWARRIPLPGSAALPGVSTTTVKGAGQGEADKIDKLLRDTGRELDAANAYAVVSAAGAKAVANLEIHFKALKAAQDAYGATADKNTGQVAALTAKIEEQLKLTERAKNFKDFNLGTVELEKANELLAAENGLINANVETRAIEIAQIKLKQELQAKGISADSEEGRRAIERRGIALETGERLKAQGDEIRKANELWTAPLKSALESIQRVGADAFEQMLTNGTFTFQSLGETFKKIVIRMAAEFMALATIRPVMTVLLNAVSPGMASTMGVGGGGGMPSMGGGGIPSMGGFGGGMSGFELPSFLGGGTIGELMAATPFASAAPVGGFADIGALMASGQAGSSAGLAAGGIQGAAQGLSVGSMMGAGLGIGMGAYSLATANGNTGKTLGGIGQMIGGGMMLIPGMQIPGMIVSALSVILPSLLGGDEYQWAPLSGANTRFDPSAGGYAQSGSQQNGGSSINGQFAGVGSTLDSLFGRVGGLTDPSRAFGASVWNNQREGTTSTYLISPTQGSNQQTYNESGDPAKAIDRLIAKVFYDSIQNNAAMNASPTLRTALGNKETTSVAQVQALLSLVDAYDQLGKVTPTAKTALDQINAQFASLTAGANEYGLALAPINAEQKKLTTRYAQDFIDGMLDPLAVQMRALDDQRKDSIASAEYIRDNVKDVYVDIARIAEYWTKKERDLKEQAYAASVDSLQALIRRLTYGDLANATADMSYAGTRGTYEATLAQARAGSGTALNNLSGTAEAFASSGRSYFASGPEYAALLEQMRRDLGEVAGNQGGGGGSAANGNEATNAVLQSNAELRGMVGALLGELSGVKDQLAAATAEMKRRA